MKAKHSILIVLCMFLIFSCFNPVDPDETTGTLVFQGVAELPSLSKPLTEETVTDIDGNVYSTITVGEKVWMAENLRVTHYRNGDPINFAADSMQWTEGSNPQFTYYEHDTTYADTFGCLYNWFAVSEERGLAPEGWHVATDEDWKDLEMAVGMSYEDANASGWRGNVADKLKSTYGWLPDSSGADRNGTDDIGFTAVPGGYMENGVFDHLGFDASFWTSTDVSGTGNAGYRDMFADRDGIRRMACPLNLGMSVRCVKDSYDNGGGTSGNRNAMQMTDMEFDIHEMYISQSVIDTGLVDTFTWHLIADNIGLVSIEDVDFTAQDILPGTYNSLKIVFVSHVIRYGRFADDTTQTMEFESNLGENAAPNNSFSVNYFGAGGSYYYDGFENEFVLMAEGENMPPYNINAGRTTTIYWKAGGENTRWTDITFDWIDCNNDDLWSPGIDSIENVEGPPGPMWTFMVEEE